MRVRRFALYAAIAAATAPLGCTEDALTGYSSDTAPGQASPTIEVELGAGDLPSWRDTTYLGFAIPATASFKLATDQSDLRARVLGRFSTLPDSVVVDTVRVAVETFESAQIRLTIDTARSVFPSAGVQTSVLEVTRSFDAEQATWVEARPGETWTTPGGDLGALLGGLLVEEPADTVLIPLAVDADSLLKAWRASDGEPGFAVVAEGDSARLRIRSVAILTEARPEGKDTTVQVVRGPTPLTFIYDPPLPAVSTRLRLAGLPSARIYLDFELPERIGGFELRGSTINRAVLEFRPLAGPDEPFRLSEILSTTTFRLLTDPFEDGERTPVGATLGILVALDPDSLAAGRPLVVPITELIGLWSLADADSIPKLRIGVRPLPESQELGLWEFGSAEDAPALQPVLRLLISPRTVFRLP